MALNSEPSYSLSDRLGDGLIKMFKLFKKTMKLRIKRYLSYTQVDCYHYLSDDLDWRSRFVWRMVHMIAFVLVCVMIWIAIGTDMSPTFTTEMPEEASLSMIPFPGIAICPINKISKEKITNFTIDLIERGKADMNVTELVHLLGYIGLAYDFEETSDDKLEIIHNLLMPYNLETILKKLAPDCDDILIQCLWRGEVQNCSEIFSIHKTSDGFCCTFNYYRENDNIFMNQNTTKETLTAVEKNGLEVMLDTYLEDYFFTRMPSIGFKLMIFNPTDFPDVPSGGCLEQMIMPKTEQFIVLDATLLTASEHIEKLPQKVRRCYIPSDSRMYDSYSDCVVTCRIKSVLHSCGCVPFLWPSNNMSDPCYLIDNGCVKKWNRMWEAAWSGEDQALEAEEGEGDAIEKRPPCSYCEPSCSDVNYKARRYSIPLYMQGGNEYAYIEDGGLSRNITHIKEPSIIHIVFEKDSFKHLSHDVLFAWYDWMGFLGGLCGLVMGNSFLNVAELIYFIVFGGPADNEDDRSEDKVVIEEQNKDDDITADIYNTLYWNELGIKHRTVEFQD